MHRIKQFAHGRGGLFSRVAVIVLMVAFAAGLLSQVAFAQNTYVITDGDRVVIYTTYATDPDIVLDEAGLTLGKDDTYTTQEGSGGTEIIISRIQMVTVSDGSQVLKIGTYGETVEALLSRLGYSLDDSVRVNQPLGAATYDGMNVELVRRETKTIRYEEAVPYETTYCYDASLPQGQTQVLIQGKDGLMSRTAEVTYENGKEVSRRVTSETMLTPPTSEVVACSVDRDTKVQEGSGRAYSVNNASTEPTETETSAPEPETEPEAEPETGGTILTSSGEALHYTGVLSVQATAYSCEEETGITASGTPARVGAIAVDPSVIPLGTRLYVVSDDGQYIYGVCVAEDTGGNINGSRIDLYFDTEAECIQFGVRSCTVYILD